MGSKREKYPEKCPWDLGPNQNLAKEEIWANCDECDSQGEVIINDRTTI